MSLGEKHAALVKLVPLEYLQFFVKRVLVCVYANTSPFLQVSCPLLLYDRHSRVDSRVICLWPAVCCHSPS